MKRGHRYEGLGFTYLLNVDKNAKTVKGQEQGYMTAILYLAPHTIAGGQDVCPYATPGCKAGCLYTAGHGTYDTVKNARIARTKYFLNHRLAFMNDLAKEIDLFREKAWRKGLKPVVRLNGTSDIDWNFYFSPAKGEFRTIFDEFPTVQFYDYTKDYRKVKRNTVPNYHLTYSYNENTPKQLAHDILQMGVCVAVVMDKESYTKAVAGGGCIDGDEHDLRFRDEYGKIVVLKAKGKATKDKTGFVWRGKL